MKTNNYFLGFNGLCFTLLLLLLLSNNLRSQTTLTLNYLHNYTAKEYNTVPQNWAIVQDKRGVMYFGNNKGILEYDGVTWNLIPIPNEITRSLSIDNTVIYVGGEGQIGYLAPDSAGKMKYFSLLEFINEQDRNFTSVWNTYTTEQGTYFQTTNKIFNWNANLTDSSSSRGFLVQPSTLANTPLGNRYNSDKMKVWNAEDPYNFSVMFYVNSEIYVRQRERGLMKMEDDSLIIVPGGEQFANLSVYSMLAFNSPGGISSIPQGKKQILIVSSNKGSFLMDTGNDRQNKAILPFHTSADNFFLEHIAYKGEVLPIATKSGTVYNYSIGSTSGGSIIINSKGELIRILNKNSGIQDETIWFQYLDREKNLWLALDNGISKIEISSPLTFINSKIGLKDRVESIIRHNGILYVATNLGVYYLPSMPDTRNTNTQNQAIDHFLFEQYFAKHITEISSECWDLLSFPFAGNTPKSNITGESKNLLLVAANHGVFQINTNKLGKRGEKLIISKILEINSSVLYLSKIDPNRVFIGFIDGLTSIYWNKGKWIKEGKIKGFNENIISIAETSEGNLWLGTENQGAINIKFSNIKQISDTDYRLPNTDYRINSTLANLIITKYDTTYGFPSGPVYVQKVLNRIVFATSKGLYRFDQNSSKISQSFQPDPSLGRVFSDGSKWIHRILEDDLGNIWMVTFTNNIIDIGFIPGTRNNDTIYSWINTPFSNIKKTIIQDIYLDPEGNGTGKNNIIWFGGTDGLIRYDPNINIDYNRNFYALIRKVTLGEDSVIFYGTYFNQPNDKYPEFRFVSLIQSNNQKPSFDYINNSLTFDYAAPGYINEKENRFKYFLEGFDKYWSDWSYETKKEYTNLPEGKYHFHIKAKNIYGHESMEAVYQFTILTPWYKTIWAYIGYGVLFIGFVYGIIRLSEMRLRAKKEKLERIVKERTSEIMMQKEEIQQQSEEIEAQKDTLEDKTLKLESAYINITDSIKYAKRIQDAILPPKKLFKELLPESFILFKPLQIVSGDFYWFYKGTRDGGRRTKTGNQQIIKSANQQIIIAAADCTGHGVPGAFMSIIGHNSLNQIVNEYGITKPSEILNQLNKLVSKTLQQKGQTVNVSDGMDIAICAFDAVNGYAQGAGNREQSEKRHESRVRHAQLQYAGAYNSMYLIRNKNIPFYRYGGAKEQIVPVITDDANALFEIKADRFSIGNIIKDKINKFTNHEFEIQKGDTIYIFSDGYPDQFGGPKGKKFRYKQFKELLISIQNSSIEKQKEILDQTFEQWKGSEEQIDDVLVMGFRL